MESIAQASADAPARPVVVGLGASAGGIEALQRFFRTLPDDPGMAFVVVMHLAPDQSSELAEVLQHATTLPVRQVTEATEVEAGEVYVVPPGKALVMNGTVLTPVDFEEPPHRRAPINQFFRSLAETAVEPVGVIFSGSGSDGAAGLRAIEEQGGLTAIQDPEEAMHASMPRTALELGRADLVLPAAELGKRIGAHRAAVHSLQPLKDADALGDSEQEVVRDIFGQVRARTGQDFSQYKRSTMLRRIRRRMHVHQRSALKDYLELLQDRPAEAKELQKDFLISVSNFFRDPDAFAALREQVLPTLFSGLDPSDSIRVWVPGCATGEEPYSLAMLFLEAAAEQAVARDQIQIFASDLDEGALAKARAGRYPESIAADVPERYLDTFFRKEKAQYVVVKPVRDRIIFTPHNLLSDPPFSKLNLISCRNLLIYLRRDLQTAVFELFNYALNDGGHLFLGSSESTEGINDLFRIVDKTYRIYQRKDGAVAVPRLPTMPLTPMRTRMRSYPGTETNDQSNVDLHRRMLEAHAPPNAIVDESYTIVRLSAGAGRYLLHPAGAPSANIVEIVRPELQIKLRAALRDAFEEEQRTVTPAVQVHIDGTTELVRIEVYPAPDTPNTDGVALVMFVKERETPPAASSENGRADSDVEDEDADTAHLNDELQRTKRQLRATIEEHETSKQEMRAANEELRSMNEEYKSMTEELETSKEELQSVNEELKTVNQELESKIEQLRAANNDLKNLMAATEIGILFLDRKLQIQRFTPPIEDLFNIQSKDVGRPIGTFTNRLEYDQLEADARQVLDGDPVEREVNNENDEWFLVYAHPYRTVDNAVEGVVFTFIDITQRKNSELELRAASARLKRRTEQVHALSSALTMAEEGERKRLSRILHDDLQQRLFAAHMRIGQAQSQPSDTAAGALEQAATKIDDAIKTTRNLSSELNPPVGKESLQDAFQWLGLQMEEAYGLSVTVDVEEPDVSAEKNVCVLLLRTARELLFNVVKHAEVEAATLILTETDTGVRVVVEDEGVGFDLAELSDATKQEGGLGLYSVRDRIEMIGGLFEIDAAPEQGTRVTIEVPRTVGDQV